MSAHHESPDPEDALAAAIHDGAATAVREVLARVPALRSTLDLPLRGGAFGATPLIVAVQQENPEMVEALLEAGANINQRSHWWAGGFHVLEHDHGMADFLVERGATLDAKSASQLGRLDDLKRLIAANPTSVHQRAGDGQTPLHVAPSIAIAEFLLEQGAEIDARDVDHEATPAQYLVRSHPEVARYLVSRGARSDILLAAALGDVDAVRRFLDADPELIHATVSEEYFPRQNPHAGGHIYIWTLGQGKTPHLIAREFGHEAVARLLQERSPGPLKLAVACETGDVATMTALLREQPDLIGQLGPTEWRRLPSAAMNDNAVAVRLMLTAGWPVATTGPQGATALHWAGFHGNTEMTREILRHHPPLEARDPTHGGTPLGWAIYGSLHGWHVDRGDYPGVVTLLLEAGAKAPPVDGGLNASRAVVDLLTQRAMKP